MVKWWLMILILGATPYTVMYRFKCLHDSWTYLYNGLLKHFQILLFSNFNIIWTQENYILCKPF